MKKELKKFTVTGEIIRRDDTHYRFRIQVEASSTNDAYSVAKKQLHLSSRGYLLRDLQAVEIH